ncbi:hypothetical protein G9A89_010149 [Geosiphon pyriformis]|nr:hypothetical protein G9A89_010149 [Geosiphon pyriformis]
MYSYRLISRFVTKTGSIKSQTRLSSFFTAGAFVNDMIWVGSSQAATQHILNIASEFFHINDISINNDKTIAIPINCRTRAPSLFISEFPISIAKSSELHHYLGIFLSFEGLSKPSLAKAHSDVCFFTNLVLRKAVSDKQFLYLVSAVLHPIIGYRTQFSFVSVSVCNKLNSLVCKGLKSKSGLPFNFSNNTIHHPSFYGLKSFAQIQSESKVTSLISFANSTRILGYLFSHRSHNLQVLCWHPVHSLSVLVRYPCLTFSASLDLSSFFFHSGDMALSLLINSAIVMWWKRLDPHGLTFEWFVLSIKFLLDTLSSHALSPTLVDVGLQSVLVSPGFMLVRNQLSRISHDDISVYMDGSLTNLGTRNCTAGTGVFFSNIDLGLDIGVLGLLSSTLAEMQAIALALECVPSSSSVRLFSDSQAALNACKSELGLVCLDFRNLCWVERQLIVNTIRDRNLMVEWHKVKVHFADAIVRASSHSGWFLPSHLNACFLLANKIGSGSKFLFTSLLVDIDWLYSSLVWHPDSHMAAGHTSKPTADAHTFFMKALHHQLPVVYPSVLCLYCDKMETSDHVFSCEIDKSVHLQILNTRFKSWVKLFGLFLFSSCVLQLLSSCASNVSVSMALFKEFVFSDWSREAVNVFKTPKVANLNIVEFVRSLGLAFKSDIWLVRAKYCAFMERNNLIPLDGSFPISVLGLASRISAGVVRLLGVVEACGVRFGFHKHCSFFFGIGNSVSVHIAA